MRRFWWIVHNLIAHPLLLTDARWAYRFHDWTARCAGLTANDRAEQGKGQSE